MENKNGFTEAEQRQIGDAEVSQWTITKPGGTPKTLKEHANDRMTHAEKQRIFDAGMARDNAEREQAAKELEIYTQEHPELYPSDS